MTTPPPSSAEAALAEARRWLPFLATISAEPGGSPVAMVEGLLASLAAARDRAEAMEARLRWALLHRGWLTGTHLWWNTRYDGQVRPDDRYVKLTHDGTPAGRWQATLDALDQARKGEG